MNTEIDDKLIRDNLNSLISIQRQQTKLPINEFNEYTDFKSFLKRIDRQFEKNGYTYIIETGVFFNPHDALDRYLLDNTKFCEKTPVIIIDIFINNNQEYRLSLVKLILKDR
jgi:hypothetical protein